MTLFGFNVEKALPYLLGGAFLFWVYKRFFGLDVVDVIDVNTSKARVDYITMTEQEKDAYAQKQITVLKDFFDFRVFPSFRDNSDVVALVKGNSFCIERMGKMYDKWYRDPLSFYLGNNLASEDVVRIQDELERLRIAGY